MYSHLLDGDLASNQLSWQWIAGAFSNKKYYANQDNINTFFKSSQKNTFLDIGYDGFSTLETPQILLETLSFELQTVLPDINSPKPEKNKTTLIYNYYNLDPVWHPDEDVQRILLLEPSVFKKNPVQQKNIEFVIGLTQNIPGIKLFTGEFNDLCKQLNQEKIIYKEHPLNVNYKGNEEPREWLSSVSGYFPSFFAFWKKCKKELRQ
jgi:deoxyribodipyrimidine photo-lyase